jgi:hypothetical protein
MHACRVSFEFWDNAKENIMKMQHVEDITRYIDSLEEIIDYNLYALNKEKGYDTEITTDVEKKMIAVNGKNKPVKDSISFPQEVKDTITTEERRSLLI